MPVDKVFGHREQVTIVASRPTVFNAESLTLNMAGFGKAPSQSRKQMGRVCR
jgi:hypothetical protein